MKIKWVELTEDDPIFNRGFMISSPKLKIPKQEVNNEKIEKRDKIKRENKKKGGLNPPNCF